jgi:hypothetical protein
MEVWKDVVGYEEIYEVSTKGRVRSAKDKTTKSKLHGVRKWQQRILKQKTDKNGYKRVNLWKKGNYKTLLVHRLVADAFIKPADGKEYVNHVDGNPSNNYVENLEWCDHSENLIHAYENRLNQSPDPIILYNTITKEMKYFYGKAEASRFLGRNHGYISNLLKKGEAEVDEYEIFSRSGD